MKAINLLSVCLLTGSTAQIEKFNSYLAIPSYGREDLVKNINGIWTYQQYIEGLLWWLFARGTYVARGVLTFDVMRGGMTFRSSSPSIMSPLLSSQSAHNAHTYIKHQPFTTRDALHIHPAVQLERLAKLERPTQSPAQRHQKS